jgi:multidrug efflux pump subunit AcrA (membrane-fusion protein)
VTFKHKFVFLLLSLLMAGSAYAQRERIRLSNAGGTKVSGTQALELTLTVTPASHRDIQQIVRTAGQLDRTRKTLTVRIDSPESEFIAVGQRVRAFSLQAKSSMFQAKITRVSKVQDHSIVEATLSGEGLENSSGYVMEITVNRGNFLSIPSEAIIEEGGGRRIVYVEKQEGQYLPTEIQTGFQGELLTEVVKGLNEGDRVVTFGSFFIDSQYKLKLSDSGTTK